MKKVTAFVWNNFNNDGRVYRECKSLVDHGFDVTLICLSEIGKAYEVNVNGIHVVKVMTLKGRMLKALGMLCSLVAMTYCGIKQKADYYHSNDLSTLIQGFVSSRITGQNSKLIYDSHEIQKFRHGKSRHFVFIEKALISKASNVIVTNAYRKEILNQIYPSIKIDIVHNYSVVDNKSLEAIDYHTRYSIDADNKIILYQGGMQVGRGLIKAIMAMKYVDDCTLIFVGNGPIRQNLIQVAKEEKVDAKVIFLDAVPYQELEKYTKGAYIGLQLLEDTCINHKTALSNKLFEYMKSGIPVVASNIREISKVVNSEGVGIVVEQTEPEFIAEAINSLVQEQALYNRCKINCEKAIHRYNWLDEQKNYLSLFGV